MSKIQDVIGEILTNKLANSKYKKASRDIQLAYLLGITTAIIEQSCYDDNQTVHRLLKQLERSDPRKNA